MNETIQLNEQMPLYPSVFAVGNEYQIFLPFTVQAIVKVAVGERIYYDECNGILRSNMLLHRVILPQSVLDGAKEYTVIYNEIIERKPYFPTMEPEVRLTFRFRPVKNDGDLHIYHIADAHNLVAEPIAAGQYFGNDLDLLVLNGDIPDHSGRIENFNAIYQIASGVTRGECPIVYARGNHDNRGIHAEEMPFYTPTQNGKTYYSFRVGRLWGLILDCGEDKADDHPEYGGTVCFHAFREAQTEYIREIIRNAEREYAAEGIEYRWIIAHAPFTYRFKPPFDIEEGIYREWSALIRENVHPTLMLYGHQHELKVCPVGGEYDTYGQGCTAIIGAKPIYQGEKNFFGCAITLKKDKTEAVFNDSKENIVGKCVF